MLIIINIMAAIVLDLSTDGIHCWNQTDSQKGCRFVRPLPQYLFAEICQSCGFSEQKKQNNMFSKSSSFLILSISSGGHTNLDDNVLYRNWAKMSLLVCEHGVFT